MLPPIGTSSPEAAGTERWKLAGNDRYIVRERADAGLTACVRRVEAVYTLGGDAVSGFCMYMSGSAIFCVN